MLRIRVLFCKNMLNRNGYDMTSVLVGIFSFPFRVAAIHSNYHFRGIFTKTFKELLPITLSKWHQHYSVL